MYRAGLLSGPKFNKRCELIHDPDAAWNESTKGKLIKCTGVESLYIVKIFKAQTESTHAVTVQDTVPVDAGRCT